GWPPRSANAAAAPAGSGRGRDINLSDADLQAFQTIHAAVQEAWSTGDLARLRPLMTPEMLSYFSEELTRNTSQGVRNIVSNVELLKGELAESWEEGDLQYATAYLKWRAIDYLVRVGRSPGDPDWLVSGDPRPPVEAEELWTFVRRSGGGGRPYRRLVRPARAEAERRRRRRQVRNVCRSHRLRLPRRFSAQPRRRPGRLRAPQARHRCIGDFNPAVSGAVGLGSGGL